MSETVKNSETLDLTQKSERSTTKFNITFGTNKSLTFSDWQYNKNQGLSCNVQNASSPLKTTYVLDINLPSDVSTAIKDAPENGISCTCNYINGKSTPFKGVVKSGGVGDPE